jgi:hypothetical protein
MSIDPDRLAELRSLQLAALVRGRWPDVPDTARPGPFPEGATLVDDEGGRVWLLLGDDAWSRLGAALAVARRAGADEVHLLTEDRDGAGILARRASQFAEPAHVWVVEGRDLTAAEPALPATEPALPPEAEFYRPVFEAAGLAAVVEGGVLLGEYLGLEVARVVADPDGGAHVETGVGRFDREASDLVFEHESEAQSIARVVELASRYRHAGAQRHPVNQMVAERWLRAALVTDPSLVGLASLEPLAAAVPRRNLLETGVASARGVDLEGRPVVVACSTGVYLDLVPTAADDRLAHDPDARLLLALPERDIVPVTVELAQRLARPAEVVTVADGWQAVAERGR